MATPSSTASAATNGGVQANSDLQFNQAAGFLNAENRRSIDSPVYQSSPYTVKVTTDTVIKRMLANLDLEVQTTYSSGSPLVVNSPFDGICDSIVIRVDGKRTIKQIKPRMARLMASLVSGIPPRKAYSKSASAFTTTRAGKEWLAGNIAYPTTTQYLQINEALPIWFENPFGYGGSREQTELDIRNASSCDMTFYWKSIDNLQQAAASPATVNYGTPVVSVRTSIIENKSRPLPQQGQMLFDYTESFQSKSYSSGASAIQEDLHRGAYYMGLSLLCLNGDATKEPNDVIMKNLQIKVNTNLAIQGPVDLVDYQDDNQSRFGVVDALGAIAMDSPAASALSAGAHPLKGYAHINLMKAGDWRTLPNTSTEAGVSSLKVQFQLNTSGASKDAGTYTVPVEVVMHEHEITPYIFSR